MRDAFLFQLIHRKKSTKNKTNLDFLKSTQTPIQRIKITTTECRSTYVAYPVLHRQPNISHNQLFTSSPAESRACRRPRPGRGGSCLLLHLTATQLVHLNQNNIQNGPYQADRPQVHRRQGSPQAARHQGRSQECPRHRRRQEAPPLPPRYWSMSDHRASTGRYDLLLSTK